MSKNDSMLPGFETAPVAEQSDTPDQPTPPPAAETPAATVTPATHEVPAPASEAKKPFRRGLLAAITLVSVCTGIAIVATYRLVHPRVYIREIVREVCVEPEGIPTALLPETADPALWDIVASMSGPFNGIPMQFKRGMTTVNSVVYKVCLDFCRAGEDIYVRVTGDGKSWVAKVDQHGRILKTYPTRSQKPLRELFGRPARER